jgi:hypothetical protein
MGLIFFIFSRWYSTTLAASTDIMNTTLQRNFTILPYNLGYINPEIKYGDMLTAFSILISLIALSIAWYKDRLSKKNEYADKIRSAASLIVAKLDLWKTSHDYFLEELDPLILRTGVIMAEKEQEKARYYLWDELVKKITKKSFEKELDEIKLAYINLYGYNFELQTKFFETINKLKYCNRKFGYDLLRSGSETIYELKDEGLQKDTKALFWNKIKTEFSIIGERYQQKFDDEILELRTDLINIIEANDDEIIKKHQEMH